VYTPQDVTSLLEYARLRGVRVVLELDAPSHSGNGWQWGEAAGLGQLAVCVNQQPWRKFCIQPPCGQLNPTNPNLYLVLRDIYRDILDVFPPGEALHMGGDEVSSSSMHSYMPGVGK
jgi:hexosaminidase